MSREHGRNSASDREEAKRILATATMEELESIVRRAGDIRIDVRGPYPTIIQGMRTRKVDSYVEAVKTAAAIALGLDKIE